MSAVMIRPNLVAEGVECTASAIKMRIIAKRERCSVYVDPAGDVHCQPARDDERRSVPRPVDWLVGVYSRAATTEQIAQDLHCRMTEIREAS